jgi:tetratricopeptide (TPR) repeat protein
LAVSAAVSAVAVWMKLADKHPRLLLQLVLVSVVLAAVGFVAAAVGRLADLREKRVRQVADWQATVRRLVTECRDDALPRLSEVSDAALGATPTRYTIAGNAPYVSRPAVDGQLAALLAAGGPPFGFVMVVGPSKAGKSRTAAQAARAAWSGKDPVAVLPHGGEALAELMRLDPPLPLRSAPDVVWLDDVTEADLRHLSADVLDRVAQRAVVVATMTDARWNQVRNSSGEVAPVARAALRRAVKVALDFDLTEDERADAARLYPHERVAASIAETLVGGQQLVDKLRAGRVEEPAGCAIVRAAVDARRAGLSRPISEGELRVLYPLYLRRLRIDLDPTAALFEQGLSWARKPVASQVALMTGAMPGSWDVLDYVVAVEDGQHGEQARPILDQVWSELIAMISPGDALDLGFGAYRRGVSDSAVAAFHVAVDSGHADVAPLAAGILGELLEEQGEVAAALAAYQVTVDSGHAEYAPAAAVSLGLLKQQGDAAGARAAFQVAVDSGHPDEAPKAAGNLGMLLKQQGDAAGARVAFQVAVDSGHADYAPAAAVSLGALLKQQGDVTGARVAFQVAVDSGHPDAAPLGAYSLGLLLAGQGEVAAARAAYQLAIDSRHERVAPLAIRALRELSATT